MEKIISFGEVVDGYIVNVINEREARAAAGILFLFAILSFLYALNYMDFRYTKIFIIFFMIDFFIRVMINPKYAPSMIAGRIFIANQKPEYVGAPPKRFAWSFGLGLAIIMFVLVVILEFMTPVKIGICLLCLTLLFSEAVFGICLGCKIYNFVLKREADYCPGGVCEIREKESIQFISPIQLSIVAIAVSASLFFSYSAWTMGPTVPMDMGNMNMQSNMDSMSDSGMQTMPQGEAMTQGEDMPEVENN